MEPSHTSLANTPSHIALQSGPAAASAGGRWDNVRDEKAGASKTGGSKVKEEGVILLLSDPSHIFSTRFTVENSPVAPGEEGAPQEGATLGGNAEKSGSAQSSDVGDADMGKNEAKDGHIDAVGTHIRYKVSSVMTSRGSSAPKRGDLVSFGKTRGAKLVKDIRVDKPSAATSVRGILTDIDTDAGTAVFASSSSDTNPTIKYEINLAEVVSCDKSLLKDKEQVDGILHEGKIFGVCRTKDIYLASSFGRNSSGSSGGLKERPRLNLTVKKELQGMGGQIMAQSRMAKGPDGTNGFAFGWTGRTSLYTAIEDEEIEEAETPALSLSAAASEFVPNFAMPDSTLPSFGSSEAG
jgi:hypothetical protein